MRFKSEASGKYDAAEDGFDGFLTTVDIIKSRVSASNKSVRLIYDKNTGIDMVRSTVEFVKELGLVGGNRNGYYFVTDKDEKFTLQNIPKDFRENPKLFKIMKDTVIQILEESLSGILPDELIVPEEEMNFYDL